MAVRGVGNDQQIQDPRFKIQGEQETGMKRFALILVAVFAVVVAACSGGGDNTTTTVLDDGGATTTVDVGSDGTTTTVTIAGATTTLAAAGNGDNDDSCLEGTWTLEGQPFFDAIMAEMSAEEAQGASFEYVDGDYQAVIGGDGSFIDRRVDWHFAVTSPAGAIEMIMNHERTGQWVADAGIISVTLPSGDAPDTQILIDGEPFEFPGGAMPFSVPAMDWVPAAYSCDGDTLTITAEGITSTWNRS
jgi:hypothetical protein